MKNLFNNLKDGLGFWHRGGAWLRWSRHSASGGNRVKAAAILVCLIAGLGGSAVASGDAAAHPALAQAAAPPTPVNWQEMVVGATLGAVAMWGVAYYFPRKADKVKVQQPLRVMIDEEMHKRFVSKSEFDLLASKVNTLDDKIDQARIEILSDGEKRKDAILHKQHQDAVAIHFRVDKIAEEMPQRIITLLRSTGALRRLP